MLALIDQIDKVVPKKANREIIFSMEHYYNPGTVRLNSTIIDVSENTEGKISGKCLGLYGDIVLFENEGQQFMCSLKKLISYKVSFSKDVERMSFEPQQTSLF